MTLKSKLIDQRNVFHYNGARFVIDWDEFTIGSSVFIPSPHPKELRTAFADIAAAEGMFVFGKIVIENGMYGVRFWRSI
jgi:hypothetical protein